MDMHSSVRSKGPRFDRCPVSRVGSRVGRVSVTCRSRVGRVSVACRSRITVKHVSGLIIVLRLYPEPWVYRSPVPYGLKDSRWETIAKLLIKPGCYFKD